MKKFIRWGISAGASLLMFIVATAFHKLETIPDHIIDGETQVLKLTENSNTAGVFMLIIMLVLMGIGGIFGAKERGSIVSLFASVGLGITRVLAMLSMISYSTNIVMFESKEWQIVQFFLVIGAIIDTFTCFKHSWHK